MKLTLTRDPEAFAARTRDLFDVTNATSNKIYREVGFRSFGGHEEWTFERP